ncbi:hypothetical protein [Flagellimonas sp.]|uniref:hypothetical protein n=1 Tax=Flagellimonas sp. TaxID=2058762 RepID=UPI003B504877
MASKSNVLFAFAFILAINLSFSNQCDNYYAKVTYGLNHTKKALSATNFEHQMYYADRAKKALEQSKSFMEECGCAKTEDKTLDILETLDKAIEPVDWDAGRFFSKKAKKQINELITILDECTLGMSTTVIEDSDESTIENEAYVDAEATETNSMEMEMIKVFDKHAKDRLKSTERAIEQLVQFSKSFNSPSDGKEDDPNSLAAHQKAYLLEAKQLLEQGLKALEKEQ